MAWIKADAKAILAIHEHVITNNDRLSVTHNDYNTWTLVIRSVKMEDRGQYMCQVNTDPMKMQVGVYRVAVARGTTSTFILVFLSLIFDFANYVVTILMHFLFWAERRHSWR